MSLLRTSSFLNIIARRPAILTCQCVTRSSQNSTVHRIVTPAFSTSCLGTTFLENTDSKRSFPLLNHARCYSKKAKTGGKKSKTVKPKVELSSEELNTVFDHDVFKHQLEQTLTELKQSYAKQLTLRTTTASFEQLVIHTDDGKFPLIQLAQITQKSPQLLIINMASTPQYVTAIKHSIEGSGLNVNPQQEGTSLFVPVPKVTREHREALAKSAKSLCDKTKVKLREVQNRYTKDIKKQKGNHSEDLLHALHEHVLFLVHQFSEQAETLMDSKQKELLS